MRRREGEGFRTRWMIYLLRRWISMGLRKKEGIIRRLFMRQNRWSCAPLGNLNSCFLSKKIRTCKSVQLLESNRQSIKPKQSETPQWEKSPSTWLSSWSQLLPSLTMISSFNRRDKLNNPERAKWLSIIPINIPSSHQRLIPKPTNHSILIRIRIVQLEINQCTGKKEWGEENRKATEKCIVTREEISKDTTWVELLKGTY